MAASSSPINGTDILVSISEDSGSSYDTIGFCTSANVSWSMDVRDITTKDDGGRRKIGSGKSSWSISCEGLVTYSTTTDVDKPNDIYTLADGKTSVFVKIGSATTGEYMYSGDSLITQYSQEAGVEDNNTFSVTFEGNGTLTQAAVS